MSSKLSGRSHACCMILCRVLSPGYGHVTVCADPFWKAQMERAFGSDMKNLEPFRLVVDTNLLGEQHFPLILLRCLFRRDYSTQAEEQLERVKQPQGNRKTNSVLCHHQWTCRSNLAAIMRSQTYSSAKKKNMLTLEARPFLGIDLPFATIKSTIAREVFIAKLR